MALCEPLVKPQREGGRWGGLSSQAQSVLLSWAMQVSPVWVWCIPASLLLTHQPVPQPHGRSHHHFHFTHVETEARFAMYNNNTNPCFATNKIHCSYEIKLCLNILPIPRHQYYHYIGIIINVLG